MCACLRGQHWPAPHLTSNHRLPCSPPSCCSEGLLSDLQAGDSGQPTPSQGTDVLHSPRTPTRHARQPPAAQQQGAAARPDEQAAAALGDGLPRLPRIRTRVGQRRPEGADTGSKEGSGGGGSGGAGELVVQ